jgi:hypothetical protein
MATALIISIALNIVFIGVICIMTYFAFHDPDKDEARRIKESMIATANAQKQRAAELKERNEKAHSNDDIINSILTRGH